MEQPQQNLPGVGGNPTKLSPEEAQRRLDELKADAIYHQTEDLYTQVLFYSVAVFTGVTMALGTCEMLASSPLPKLASLLPVKHAHIPLWFPTVYLPLLASFVGFREWMRRKQSKFDDPHVILEAQRLKQKVSRELKLMIVWLVYLLGMAFSDGFEIVGTVPNALLLIASEVIVSLTTGHAVHANHTKKMQRQQKENGLGIFARSAAQAATGFAKESIPGASSAQAEIGHAVEKARLSEEHRDIVFNYLDTNEWIKREQCQHIANISEDQASRLLGNLVKEDELETEGSGRNIRYRRKLKNPDTGPGQLQ
jgi:hypothetical protein